MKFWTFILIIHYLDKTVRMRALKIKLFHLASLLKDHRRPPSLLPRRCKAWMTCPLPVRAVPPALCLSCCPQFSIPSLLPQTRPLGTPGCLEAFGSQRIWLGRASSAVEESQSLCSQPCVGYFFLRPRSKEETLWRRWGRARSQQEEGPFTKNPSPHGYIPKTSYPNENMRHNN